MRCINKLYLCPPEIRTMDVLPGHCYSCGSHCFQGVGGRPKMINTVLLLCFLIHLTHHYLFDNGSHSNFSWATTTTEWALSVMMTSSNGNIFRVTGPLWGNPPVTGGFPPPVTRSFDVFFDLRLNKRLSKRCSLWRRCKVESCLGMVMARTKPKGNDDWRTAGCFSCNNCNITVKSLI